MEHTHLIFRFVNNIQNDDTRHKADDLAKKLRSQPEVSVKVYDVNTGDEDPIQAIKQDLEGFATRAFTEKSKFYLLGHSDFASQKLCDRDAKWVAEFLNKVFVTLKVTKIKNVNVLACSLGRDVGSTHETLVIQSANSFASDLHSRLQSKVDVIARVFDVQITGLSGKKLTVLEDSSNASLRTPVSKRPNSKLKFYWEGNEQKRRWVDYNFDQAADNDDYSVDRMLTISFNS